MSSKDAWAKKHIHRMNQSNCAASMLEDFVDKYYPKNVVPSIDNKKYYDKKQWAIDTFIDSYQMHRADGKQIWSSRYSGIADTVNMVLDARAYAYE